MAHDSFAGKYREENIMVVLAPMFTIAALIPFGIYFHKVLDRSFKEYQVKEMSRRIIQLQAVNDRLISDMQQLQGRVKKLEQASKTSD